MRRDPHNHLQQAFLDLAAILKYDRTRWHDLELHADPLSASAYDQSSRSGISDPTPQQAANLAWAHELQDEILSDAAELAGLARILTHKYSRVPTFREAKQLCSGGAGMIGADVEGGWGVMPHEPRCENIPAYTHGHNAGLCANHIRYRNKWEKERRDAAAA